MARDDWRLRVELNRADTDKLYELLRDFEADELKGSTLAVTHDDDTVFVYAATALELEPVKQLAERELGDRAAEIVVEHWLGDEERWNDDPPGPSPDDEVLAEGYAPWEVRIPCPNHRAARELADRLEAEGYGIVRRWRFVIAGCASREQAEELAKRLHGEVEPGGELVWDQARQTPFIFIEPL
jgi:hypothetical protein